MYRFHAVTENRHVIAVYVATWQYLPYAAYGTCWHHEPYRGTYYNFFSAARRANMCILKLMVLPFSFPPVLWFT
jgi:hypothetical protein